MIVTLLFITFYVELLELIGWAQRKALRYLGKSI